MERYEQERMQTGYQPMTTVTRTRPRMGTGFWISAFAFGAAIGGALGLLFAPRKGSETRHALMENAPGVSREFRKRMSRAAGGGRATPSSLIEQTQRQLDELSQRALDRLDDAKLRSQIMQKRAELRYLQGRERLRRIV